MTNLLSSAVERSVIGLHDVFTDWLGDGSAGLAFEPIEQVLAPGFVLVGPDGRIQARPDLLAALRTARGSRPGLVIEARATALVRVQEPLVVATYEEWQRTAEAPGWTARVSMAILEQDASVPWGFRWIRVQETCLPA